MSLKARAADVALCTGQPHGQAAGPGGGFSALLLKCFRNDFRGTAQRPQFAFLEQIAAPNLDVTPTPGRRRESHRTGTQGESVHSVSYSVVFIALGSMGLLFSALLAFGVNISDAVSISDQLGVVLENKESCRNDSEVECVSIHHTRTSLEP